MLTSSWRNVSLGDIATLQRGYDLPYRSRKAGPFPIVTSSGISDTHVEARVSGPGVVTGRYGTIGQVFFVQEDFWPHNTTLFVKDFHGNDPLFVFHLLQTIDYKSHSGKSGVPGVNRNDLHQLSVTLPPTVAEQRAIAAALSDVDALIDALDQLIAKKHDLKQAAMQQLLTGKQRLPGFDCSGGKLKKTVVGVIPKDWEVSTVGKEFEIQLGKMLDSAKNIGIPKPYLGNKAVQWDQINIDNLPMVAMSRSDMERFRLRRDDLLVCEGGEIGRAAIWESPLEECYYQKALHRLRPLRGFDSRFMLALLRHWTSHNMLSDYVTQTSIAHLSKEKLAIVPMPLPSPKEQRAIASVLSDMDAEVAALEQRRDKTRALKHGMTQELLTGKTRLIEISQASLMPA